MTYTQRNILITVGILLVTSVLIIFAIFAVSNNSNSNSSVITDRDTGEVYDKEVNNDQTGGSGVETGDTILFGIEPFIEQLTAQDLASGYINPLKQALWNFSDTRLENKFESVTLRPQDLTITETQVTGTIRLGQTDTILPITIQPTKDSRQAVITINQDGTDYKGKYVYVSGVNNSENLLFTITQKNTNSTDLEIKTFDGYREVALDYLESIGYQVPDFVITFTNYENPFI